MKAMDYSTEEWRKIPIEGMDNYEVSNFGRVKTLRFKGGKVLTPKRFHQKGYPIARIREDGKTEKAFFIHRLVALAFIPNPKDYPQVNHIDCDKTNNHFSNLEWCTNRMNYDHAMANGLMRHTRGQDHASARLTDIQVLEIRELFEMGQTRRQLAEKYGTKPSNIKDIVLRRSWKHI